MALAILKRDLMLWNDALSHYEQRGYSEALDLFNSITYSARIYTNIGLIHCEMGNLQDALQALTKAIAMDQTSTVAYFQRAFCHYSLGQLQNASDDLSEAALFMKKERERCFDDQGLHLTVYLSEILYNKGIVLLKLGRQSDGLSCLGSAVLNKVLPAHHLMYEALSYPEKDYDLYKVPSGQLFQPTESQMKFLAIASHDESSKWIVPEKGYLDDDTLDEKDSLYSTDKTVSDPSDAQSFMSESTYVSCRSTQTLSKPKLFRRHTLDSSDTTPTPSRLELELQLGRDTVAPSGTEISTIPCAGVRITHGKLIGLMAFRFVVQPDVGRTTSKKTPAVFLNTKSIVANFILDTGIGTSLVPLETVRALGYNGRLRAGTEVSLIIQGVKTKCAVGADGEAGRLSGHFLTAGALTFTFDTTMNAPVLYVADHVPSIHFIPRTVAEMSKRLSFKDVVASLLPFRK